MCAVKLLSELRLSPPSGTSSAADPALAAPLSFLSPAQLTPHLRMVSFADVPSACRSPARDLSEENRDGLAGGCSLERVDFELFELLLLLTDAGRPSESGLSARFNSSDGTGDGAREGGKGGGPGEGERLDLRMVRNLEPFLRIWRGISPASCDTSRSVESDFGRSPSDSAPGNGSGSSTMWAWCFPLW